MSKKKILVVEDNSLNLKLFQDLLEAHDYDVQGIQEGEGAFDLACSFLPDLILMDIQMHGISGFDIIKQLKSDTCTSCIPIIAVTAFAMEDDEEKILKSGCEMYIAKPISIGPFLEAVAEVLQQGASS